MKKDITKLQKYKMVDFFKEKLEDHPVLRVRKASSEYGDFWMITSGGVFGIGAKRICTIGGIEVDFYEPNPSNSAWFDEIVSLAKEYEALKGREVTIGYIEYV